MSKFKVGDEIIRTIMTFDLTAGQKYIVASLHGSHIKVCGSDNFYCGSNFELVEDKSKYHKHHDLIIAWAKGAVIQHRTIRCGRPWYDLPNPSWQCTDYRVRPENPNSDKIDKIEKELLDMSEKQKGLASQLSELKG